jgi:Ninjurin
VKKTLPYSSQKSFIQQVKSLKEMNINNYASRKSLAQGMLDLALLTANASQLKYILSVGESHEFYQLLFVLILTSIALQVCDSLFVHVHR